MSRSPADARGSARVAVVGAEGPAGARLREALAELGIAGSRVDLFGVTGGEVVLSEYDGEARLIQEPDPAEVAEHHVIFLCEAGEPSLRVLESAGPGTLVVDLAGCCASATRNVPLVHLDFNPEAARAHEGVVAVPHALSIVLAEILHPVERTFGVRRFSAVVLRPAADFGERGLEELRDQTVGLLRFGDPPKDVFGGQLAFNLIFETTLGNATEAGLEQRVARELARLLGWSEPRATVALVTVPVFHGHAVVGGLELVSPTRIEALRAAWPSDADPVVTPIEAAGEHRTTVSNVREDGLGGYWLWGIAGEAGIGPAVQAVHLARRIGGL